MLLLPTIICGIAFYLETVDYQIAALFIFCLVSVTVGNGLLRLMTNQIIKNVVSSHQQISFVFAESISSNQYHSYLIDNSINGENKLALMYEVGN